MTWWSTSCRKLVEAKKIGARPDDQNGGIKTTHWFWGAAGRIQAAADKNQIAREADDDEPEKELGSETSADKELNDLLLENPSMVAAALPQAMTAKGLKVVKTTEAFRRLFPRGLHVKESKLQLFGKGRVKAKKKKEADSASTFAQVTREAKFQFKSTNLRESVGDDGVGPTRFKVVLLQEGLGNFGDAFYYHRDALESAVPVFTGSKIYADHPSTVDEEIRPERSVRDVLGHFENIKIETDKTERAMLTGEVCILPDKPFEWARGLMRHAIEHSKKFPDKDFIGLSINASGDADETPIDTVLKDAPASAKPKLVEAKNHGIESVKVVRQIKSAVSCDLVTEAGAGGKIINFIEGGNHNGKKRSR